MTLKKDSNLPKLWHSNVLLPMCPKGDGVREKIVLKEKVGLGKGWGWGEDVSLEKCDQREDVP